MKIKSTRVKEIFPWVLGGVVLIGSFLFGIKNGKSSIEEEKSRVADSRNREIDNGA